MRYADEHILASGIHWDKATLALAADGIIRRFCQPPKEFAPKKKHHRRYDERPCNKKRHKTAAGARKHICLLVESGAARKNEMNFYRCEHCHWLHVGHVSQEAAVRRQGKRKYREIDG